MNKKIIVFDDILQGKYVCVDLLNMKIQIKKECAPTEEDTISENEVEEFINKTQSRKRNKAVIGVATTYKCNLNCTYCFEKGFQRQDKPVEDTDIINFVKLYAEQYELDEIKMIYTGGEPLLNKQMILHVSGELSHYFRKCGVKYSFSIVTNGTVDFMESIDEMCSYGLDLIQVSLDGTKEIHNQRRKSCFDAYEISRKTIEELSGYSNITIMIRTNVDSENTPYLEDMVRELDTLPRSNIIFDFFPTEETYCKRDGKVVNNFNYENVLFAYNVAKKYGFMTKKANPFYGRCMSYIEEGCFIDPQGNVYKCGGFLGHDAEVIGNIYNIKDLSIAVIKYTKLKIRKECKECGLFPICLGGCIYQKHYSKECSESYQERIREKLRLQVILYLIEKNVLRAN